VNKRKCIRKREGECGNKAMEGGKLTGVRGATIIRLRVSMVVEVHCLKKKKSNVGQYNMSSIKTFLCCVNIA